MTNPTQAEIFRVVLVGANGEYEELFRGFPSQADVSAWLSDLIAKVAIWPDAPELGFLRAVAEILTSVDRWPSRDEPDKGWFVDLESREDFKTVAFCWVEDADVRRASGATP